MNNLWHTLFGDSHHNRFFYKFENELSEEILLPYTWFLKYHQGYEYHILLSCISGIFTSILLYSLLKYYIRDINNLSTENSFKKSLKNQPIITKFIPLQIFFIYIIFFIVFGLLYNVDILTNTLDIFMAVVSAGILSISTYFQFYFFDKGYHFKHYKLELEYLKMENDNCIQILNMLLQTTLFSISGIIVTGFFKWIFNIHPKIFHTTDYIIQLSVWAIWVITMLLGIIFGIIGIIMEQIKKTKFRIIKIDNILQEKNTDRK